MLESMATLILLIVGIVVFLFILAIGIYITFYPLSKTIKGGMEVLGEHAEGKQKIRKGPTKVRKATGTKGKQYTKRKQ